VDALGNPIRFVLSGGHQADITYAPALLCPIKVSGSNILGDRGYDSQAFVNWLESRDAIVTIPSRASNKVQRVCDWWLYKERHLVECFFNKIKQYRRIATRYDKLPSTFLGFVNLAAILVLLK
jgi:transposase